MGLFGFGKSNEEKASHLHHKGVNLSKKEKFEEALECYNEAISIELKFGIFGSVKVLHYRN